MKVGAIVTLTYNIDVSGSLANGSKGEILDFVIKCDGSNNVQCVIVEFQDTKAGVERRKRYPDLQKRYPNRRPTVIERIDFEYSLSKKNFLDGAKANVSQFPLALCFSSTAHKQQGLTVHKPNCLVTDLRSVFDPAQAHVILSLSLIHI